MTNLISLDFVEYGKRFLRPGTTDYMALEYSNEFMRAGVDPATNLMLLGDDGINLHESPLFRNSIGKVTAALIQLNRNRFGDIERPYIFAQVQSRKEDELDGSNGKMHRNFSQVRLTLLSQKDILSASAKGYAIYPSLLASQVSILPSKGVHTLGDYTENTKAMASGKKEITLFDSKYFISRHLPSFESEYEADLRRIFNIFFSFYDQNSINFPSPFSVAISNEVKLAPHQEFLYKLLLLQDLQMLIGRYTEQVLTFSFDDIFKRTVRVSFNGHQIKSLNNEDYAKQIILVSNKSSLLDSSSILYSKEMENILKGERFKQNTSQKERFKKSLEIYMLIEKGVGSIDKNFILLLDPHPDETIKYNLFGALDRKFNERHNERIAWVLDYSQNHPDAIPPLFNYLNFRGFQDDLLKIIFDLSQKPEFRNLFTDKTKKHTQQEVNQALDAVGWDGLFAAKSVMGINVNQALFFEDYTRVIKGDTLLEYLINELSHSVLSADKQEVFLLHSNDGAGFQTQFLIELERRNENEQLAIINNLRSSGIHNQETVFYEKCLLTLAQKTNISMRWRVEDVERISKLEYLNNPKYSNAILTVLHSCLSNWTDREITNFPPQIAKKWLRDAREIKWSGQKMLEELFEKHSDKIISSLCRFYLDKEGLADYTNLLGEQNLNKKKVIMQNLYGKFSIK